MFDTYICYVFLNGCAIKQIQIKTVISNNFSKLFSSEAELNKKRCTCLFLSL